MPWLQESSNTVVLQSGMKTGDLLWKPKMRNVGRFVDFWMVRQCWGGRKVYKPGDLCLYPSARSKGMILNMEASIQISEHAS